MSAFSNEMAALALELLTEFGEAVTITQYTRGSYSPSTLSNATGTTSGTLTGFGVPIDYDQGEIDQSLVKQGDIRVYVNAVSGTPVANDVLTFDSIDYRIVNVRRYTINSENVLYELQVRV